MTAALLLADIRQNNGHPAAPSAALLTVREAAAWIEERRGRRPSRSTIYTALRDGVRGHRLASTIVDGALHVAESDLAAFCETRDWSARSRPRAPVEKFLKKPAASALRLGRNVAAAALWSSGQMITHADFRRPGRSSQAFAAIDADLDRRGSAVAARGGSNKKPRSRLAPRAGHVVRKTHSTGILPGIFRDVNAPPPGDPLQWLRHVLIDRLN